MAGLLGALKQYLRDAGPGGALNPEVTRQGLLDSAAFATMPVPLLGDAVGLAADANRFATDPSSRTPLNFGLSALGMLPLIPNLTVWHGSPHKFPPTKKNPLGEFDPNKIGAGEGAQAYSYGHYAADAQPTAKTYLDVDPAVTPPTRRAFKGSELEPGTWEYKAASLLDGSSTLAGVRKEVSGWIKNAKPGEDVAGYQKVLDVLNTATSKADFKRLKREGYLYKVDLADEAIPKLLEWDKPIAEQSDSVKAALRTSGLLGEVENVGARAADKVRELASLPGVADWAKRDLMSVARQLEKSKSPQHVAGTLKGMQLDFGISPDGGVFKPKAQEFLDFVKTMQYVPNMDVGAGLYALASASRGGEKAASEALRNAGIPGVRYLDQISRGAGQGTYNYVVFPGGEGLLNILDRKSVPLGR